MNEILELAIKLKRLVDKEAEEEKKLSDDVPKVSTAFAKGLQFHIEKLS
jgi:hypothetical protein